jgi:hypothetical protein
MNFETLLQQISNSGSEKTASDTTSQPPVKTATVAAKEALAESIRNAVQQEKTAAANTDPIDSLIKEAQRLAEDAQTMEVIHARNCGHAFADAAAETWGTNATKFAAAQGNDQGYAMQKQAAEEQGYMDTMQKVAAEQGYIDVIQKVAAEQGYADTMEKVAAEQYNSGQQSCLEDVRTAAAQEFLKGAQEVEVLLAQTNAR